MHMHGAVDVLGQPVLLVSYVRESCVRVFDLPNFASRGVLPQVRVRATTVDVCVVVHTSV